jgi:hypothetical protein
MAFLHNIYLDTGNYDSLKKKARQIHMAVWPWIISHFHQFIPETETGKISFVIGDLRGYQEIWNQCRGNQIRLNHSCH